MAIFNGKSIKGSIGPVSFTQKGNVSIIRSKPGKGGVKQTQATKKKASLFGAVVSPLSKLVRQAFETIHLGFYDGAMVNRMNSVIGTIINQHVNENGSFTFNADSFNRLIGFDFNSNSVFNKSLLLNPKIEINDTTLVCSLPEFEIKKNLKFPTKASVCQLNFQLVLFSIKTGHWQVQNLLSLQISKSQLVQAAQSWTFNIPKGCLVVLGCSLTYKANNSQLLMNDKSFHPSTILTAFYNEGDAEINFDEEWVVLGVRLG